jgi:hypothetical protein
MGAASRGGRDRKLAGNRSRQEMIRKERSREKIPVVSDERGGVDRQCAGRLHGICQPEAERSPQPCRTRRDFEIERDRLPGFEYRAVTLRQRVVACPQRTDQHLGDRDRCHGKAQPPCRMRGKQWRKARSELRMAFEDINDRRRIDEEQCLFGQVAKIYRSHSSRSWRTARTLSFPHRPRPDPCQGVSGCCAATAPKAVIGTNAATGRPRRVMIVDRPCSAASRSSGRRLRASSAPLRSVGSSLIASLLYGTVQLRRNRKPNPRSAAVKGRAHPDRVQLADTRLSRRLSTF